MEWRVIVLTSNARSTNNKYKQCALSILTYLHLSLWLMNKHRLQKIIVKKKNKKCWPPVHETQGLGVSSLPIRLKSTMFYFFCLKTCLTIFFSPILNKLIPSFPIGVSPKKSNFNLSNWKCSGPSPEIKHDYANVTWLNNFFFLLFSTFFFFFFLNMIYILKSLVPHLEIGK